uniref:Uncharacterized protein n=1 Tax=Triticum urartu TaxID=4572 RepID=A0A8R7Q8A7_TRIUA
MVYQQPHENHPRSKPKEVCMVYQPTALGRIMLFQ